MDDPQEQCKPHKVIRIRIEADPLVAEDMASRISQFVNDEGFEVLDQSALVPSLHDRTLGRVFIIVR